MSNPVGGIGMLVSWDGDRKHRSGQSSRLHCFVGFLDSDSDHPLMIQQNVFLDVRVGNLLGFFLMLDSDCP